MSRSGYSEGDIWDVDDLLAQGRYQAQLKSAIRGKRGQKFLLDLIAALDALPEKKLVKNALESDGAFCALGALGRHRKVSLGALGVGEGRLEDDDWEDADWAKLGNAFDIAEQLARETMYVNDEVAPDNDADRWFYIRAWALRRLKPETLIGKPELAEE